MELADHTVLIIVVVVSLAAMTIIYLPTAESQETLGSQSKTTRGQALGPSQIMR